MIDRRQLVIGATMFPVAARAVAAGASVTAEAEADLGRYIDFGIKASGGPGDNASGAWMANELEKAGYRVERQTIEVPFFDVSTAELRVGGHRADVLPQAVVGPTGPGGVEGALVRIDPRFATPIPAGSIAVLELPFRRWSTVTVPLVRNALLAAERSGAVAAIIVTTGPTGGAIVLNAPADKPVVRIPVACLAPQDAEPLLRACLSGAKGRLVVDGKGGRRKAFNVLGTLSRNAAKWIVVSTPRSGWLTCAGERGPGIVTWLDLARWAPAALPGVNLMFTSNSGHEYENAGSEELVRSHAPAPVDVALWLHLGAGFAARDWQEFGGKLRPLASADPQRLCVATDATAAAAKVAFAGLVGLDQPIVSDEMRMGETGTIVAAGYQNTIGLLGAHRFHHHRDDDRRCVDTGLIAPVTAACRKLLSAAA